MADPGCNYCRVLVASGSGWAESEPELDSNSNSASSVNLRLQRGLRELGVTWGVRRSFDNDRGLVRPRRQQRKVADELRRGLEKVEIVGWRARALAGARAAMLGRKWWYEDKVVRISEATSRVWGVRQGERRVGAVGLVREGELDKRSTRALDC